ncbi:pentatricopeptide repeat-containing protein At3g63370, chloroplastic-like [Carica papaya]|uniref:pentatricopeptide repeat-containing protein At3g63370, chloroplastic-like n=1 Tax=Carica papaya TaxID=3649 RepID=UPI000B8CF35E|nr:pentatricopeptide repeat-containing protein At3g63370, chloroplastic-like [Carica papaya]
MATSIPHCYFHNTSSILKPHLVLEATRTNPPLKIPELPRIPRLIPSLKYVCKQGGLREAFQSFSGFFTQHNPLISIPEEAYAPVLELCASNEALSQGQQCGSIVNAEKLFVKMPQRTIFTWNAMIGAYVSNGEPLELGEIAANKLLELDPDNPGNYVLISNVFAASRRWKDVKGVRLRMKGSGLKKNPGCSWIEIGNKVHTFMARDKSHPESNEIYRKLAEITRKLEREGGYVAQTRFVLHNADEKHKVEMLYGHSERLAIAYGVLKIPKGTPIRITKNLRVCGDCHSFCKLVSKLLERELVIRDANRFHHFEEVRLRMKGSGLKKNPKCSWIEIGNKVHTSMARDKYLPESNEIYRKLAEIIRNLEREGGYEAQTRFVLHNADKKEKIEMLYGHSERLAIAYGVLKIPKGTPIRITKNLRVCGDCHSFCKLVSKLLERELVVRDVNRFHHFEGGLCSCGDFW